MPRQRLQWVQLPDGRSELGHLTHGLPTFHYGNAPDGLATRRQLRAQGLCPGRQDIVALLTWKRGRRWAGLYRRDLATPKRTPSLRQQTARHRAMTARRTCRTCPPGQRLKSYEVSKPDRQCFDCLATNDTAAHAA